MRIGILSTYALRVPTIEFYGTDLIRLNAEKPDVIVAVGDWALTKLGLKGKQGTYWWDGNGWTQSKPVSPELSVLCVLSVHDLAKYQFWFRAHAAAELGVPVLLTVAMSEQAGRFKEAENA